MDNIFKIIYMAVGIIMFLSALNMLLYLNHILEENSRNVYHNERNAEVIRIG